VPVLFNTQTNLAEDVPENQAQAFLDAGTHHLPLNDPQGNPVTAPLDQARGLVSQGYTQPEPEQLKVLLNDSKNQHPLEKTKAFLEGAAESGTFGLSTGLEVAAGADPEDINRRRESGYHTAGQIAGLAGSALIPGVGEANLLGAAGRGAAEAVGLGVAESAAAKIGSSAVRNAVEGAIFAAGDETSKMLSQDPNQSAETAMMDIGLSGVIGGGVGAAFGAVSPLWKASQESKVGQFLKKFSDKVNSPGSANLETPAGESIESLIDKIGVEVAPEIKSAISSNPELRSSWQTLQESTTKSGQKAQEAFHQFKSQLNDSILGSFGKTADDIAALSDMSEHDIGQSLIEKLEKEYKLHSDPLSKDFEKVKERFKTAVIDDADKAKVLEKLSSLTEEGGYQLLDGTPQGNLLKKVTSSLEHINTLEDLRKFQSAVSSQLDSPEMWGLAKKLRSVLRETEESVLESKLGSEAPDLLGAHKVSREQYRQLMNLTEEMNDRLHVGSYAGPQSFLTKLKEMGPEAVLRRLTPKNDAGFLGVISDYFPETAQEIKDAYTNQLLRGMSLKAKPGEAINASGMFKALDKWSPELREFVMPGKSQESLDAIRKLMDALPEKMNYSGTAKTLDALWSKVPAGAMGALSWITGHNPIVGAAIGQLGQYLQRDVPDAVKLAMLKYMGSEKHISGSGFKAMVDFISSTYKGENLLSKGTSALFQSGRDVLPSHLVPTENKRIKLEKSLKQVQQNPESMMNVAQDTNHYMPDHGSAVVAASSRVVNYLNQVRPTQEKVSPLDPPMKNSNAELAAYNRVLDIAEQPLVVLQRVKDGTLLPSDVQALQNMYPSLYDRMVQKVSEGIMDHGSKGNSVPYPLRMTLSMFMAHPLDSTMLPMSIMSAQMGKGVPMQPHVPSSGGGRSSGSMNKISKMPQSFMTRDQAREFRRAR
jgi:hypothetical protein